MLAEDWCCNSNLHSIAVQLILLSCRGFSPRSNARSMLTKSLSNKLLFITLVDQVSNLSTSDIFVVTFLRLQYIKFGVNFICQITIFFLKILLVLYDNVKYFTWLTSESFSHL